MVNNRLANPSFQLFGNCSNSNFINIYCKNEGVFAHQKVMSREATFYKLS